MAGIGTKKYLVTVRQGRIKPRGGVEGWFDRVYTIYAKSSRGAKSAIKNAGIKGRIIKVESGGKR